MQFLKYIEGSAINGKFSKIHCLMRNQENDYSIHYTQTGPNFQDVCEKRKVQCS